MTDLSLYFSDRFLRVAAITVFIGYSWLFARGLNPSPPPISAQIEWVGQAPARVDGQDARFQDEQNLRALIQDLDSRFALISGELPPVHLKVHREASMIYRVGEMEVELSRDLAFAPAQLARVWAKRWLLHNGGVAVRATMLRIEVAADVLAMMLLNDDSFGLPSGDAVFSTPPLSSWLLAARSYQRFCDSPWMSFELVKTCGSGEQLNPLSFRPFIDAQLWSVFRTMGVFERLRFTRQVANLYIENDASSSGSLPASLSDWRSWLRIEVDVLVPKSQRPMVLERSGLSEDDVRFDLIWSEVGDHAPHGDPMLLAEWPKDAARDGKTLLILAPESTWLYPGHVRLTPSNQDAVKAPLWVWRACGLGSVGTVMNKAVKARQLLALDTCQQARDEFAERGWSALLDGGLGAFARTFPAQPFVLFNLEVMPLAMRMGAMHASSPLLSFSKRCHFSGRETGMGGADLLGIRAAQWDRDWRAYRASGAVEAVQWFRSAELSTCS